MGTFSIWHWIIVLVIILLVFGTKKLRNIGTDLGAAVKGFKEGVKGGEEDKAAADKQIAGRTIEGEVKEKSETKV